MILKTRAIEKVYYSNNLKALDSDQLKAVNECISLHEKSAACI